MNPHSDHEGCLVLKDALHAGRDDAHGRGNAREHGLHASEAHAPPPGGLGGGGPPRPPNGRHRYDFRLFVPVIGELILTNNQHIDLMKGPFPQKIVSRGILRNFKNNILKRHQMCFRS